MFKLPTVKSAFCGCTLEEGNKIIGYIHFILYTILFIAIFIENTILHHNDEYTESHDDLLSLNSTSNATNTTEELDEYFMENELIANGFLALTSSYFNEMVFLTQIVFASYLLIGIYRKNLDYIFSWILLQIAGVVFSQALVTLYFIAFFSVYVHYAIFYLVCEEITLGIMEGYCIIVVNSYMKELMKKNDDNDEVMSPIVINSSDIQITAGTNNLVH